MSERIVPERWVCATCHQEFPAGTVAIETRFSRTERTEQGFTLIDGIQRQCQQCEAGVSQMVRDWWVRP